MMMSSSNSFQVRTGGAQVTLKESSSSSSPSSSGSVSPANTLDRIDSPPGGVIGSVSATYPGFKGFRNHVKSAVSSVSITHPSQGQRSNHYQPAPSSHHVPSTRQQSPPQQQQSVQHLPQQKQSQPSNQQRQRSHPQVTTYQPKSGTPSSVPIITTRVTSPKSSASSSSVSSVTSVKDHPPPPPPKEKPRLTTTTLITITSSSTSCVANNTMSPSPVPPPVMTVSPSTANDAICCSLRSQDSIQDSISLSLVDKDLSGCHSRDGSLGSLSQVSISTRGSPEKPSPESSPVKVLLDHWAEYVDNRGRRFYYNFLTKETSWKPPRRPNAPFSVTCSSDTLDCLDDERDESFDDEDGYSSRGRDLSLSGDELWVVDESRARRRPSMEDIIGVDLMKRKGSLTTQSPALGFPLDHSSHFMMHSTPEPGSLPQGNPKGSTSSTSSAHVNKPVPPPFTRAHSTLTASITRSILGNRYNPNHQHYQYAQPPQHQHQQPSGGNNFSHLFHSTSKPQGKGSVALPSTSSTTSSTPSRTNTINGESPVPSGSGPSVSRSPSSVTSSAVTSTKKNRLSANRFLSRGKNTGSSFSKGDKNLPMQTPQIPSSKKPSSTSHFFSDRFSSLKSRSMAVLPTSEAAAASASACGSVRLPPHPGLFTYDSARFTRKPIYPPFSGDLGSPNGVTTSLPCPGMMSTGNQFNAMGYNPPGPPTSLDHMRAHKVGILKWTRLMDNGRRIKKNWSSGLIGLSDDFLVLSKETKLSSSAKPEMVIELAGSLVDWSPEKSRRKNVFRVTRASGQQILLQDDCSLTCKEWFDSIKSAILKLPSPTESPHEDNSSPKSEQKSKDGKGLRRSKSTKLTGHDTFGMKQGANLDCSNLDNISIASVNLANGVTSPMAVSDIPPEKKKKIRDRLRLFLRRRPTLESLREKGIFKDEPVFGCNLNNLCARERSFVPKFVTQCIAAIEGRDLRADGIYRVCGNLSQVQKIRFQVNQDNYGGLWAEEDVHVLTGLLKMFFRDMKEPLLPCNQFDGLMKAISAPDRNQKLAQLTPLIRSLLQPNYETLKCLLQHLSRVKELSEENRMHIQNLAIVFGPNLMWPEAEKQTNGTFVPISSQMGPGMGPNSFAADMLMKMKSNQLVEFLLMEFSNIFHDPR